MNECTVRQLSIAATLCWGQGSTLERRNAKLRWANPWATRGCHQTWRPKPTPGVQGSQDPIDKLLAGHVPAACAGLLSCSPGGPGEGYPWWYGVKLKKKFNLKADIHFTTLWKTHGRKKSQVQRAALAALPTSHMLISILVPLRHAFQAHLNEFLRIYYSLLLTPGLEVTALLDSFKTLPKP